MENLIIDRFTVNTDYALIRLKGYIDSTNASLLKESIEFFTHEDSFRIVIDFKGINYVSSAGWGVLIGNIRDVRKRNGDILLTGMIEGVYSIYKLMELDKIFKYFKTVDEALKMYGKNADELEESAKEKDVVSTMTTVKPYTKEVYDEGVRRLGSLEDEIRFIISETPLISLKILSEELARREHGGWGIGWFKLKKMLKRMGLGTAIQRLYYAFQKAKESK